MEVYQPAPCLNLSRCPLAAKQKNKVLLINNYYGPGRRALSKSILNLLSLYRALELLFFYLHISWFDASVAKAVCGAKQVQEEAHCN